MWILSRNKIYCSIILSEQVVIPFIYFIHFIFVLFFNFFFILKGYSCIKE